MSSRTLLCIIAVLCFYIAYSEDNTVLPTETPPYSSSGYGIDDLEAAGTGVVESSLAENQTVAVDNETVAVHNETVATNDEPADIVAGIVADVVAESDVESGNVSQVEGEAGSNETSDNTSGELTINQAEIVLDPLHDSTMLTTSTETEQEVADTSNQTTVEPGLQTDTITETDTSVETDTGEEGSVFEDSGDQEFATGMLSPTTSGTYYIGAEYTADEEDSGYTVDVAQEDTGYTVLNDDPFAHDAMPASDTDLLQQIEEIEEEEEEEASKAGWADAIATTQVITIMLVVMISAVVVYVLYIARKKNRKAKQDKEYRNLLQDDFDSDEEKGKSRRKRYN